MIARVGRFSAMNILPVLKALKPVIETAAQVVAVSRTLRQEKRSVDEEIASLERLAEQQAANVKELAVQTGSLADRVVEMDARLQAVEASLATLNRRSSWLVGLVVAALSAAVTALVLALRLTP